MPQHHPTDEMLLDYAAGSGDEPSGLLLATHLALCPSCRRQVRDYEAVGGALLEAAGDGAPPPSADLARMLERLDEPEIAPPALATPVLDDETARLVPEPLRGYLRASLQRSAWRKLAPGLAIVDLPVRRPGVSVRLMRIRRGRAMPHHGHRGAEQVLVLDGGFSDEHGHYARGDVALSGPDHLHQPVADADRDCLCLTIVEGRLRLTSRLGRLVSFFIR